MKTRVPLLALFFFSYCFVAKYTYRQLSEPFASHGDSFEEYSEPNSSLRVAA